MLVLLFVSLTILLMVPLVNDVPADQWVYLQKQSRKSGHRFCSHFGKLGHMHLKNLTNHPDRPDLIKCRKLMNELQLVVVAT